MRPASFGRPRSPGAAGDRDTPCAGAHYLPPCFWAVVRAMPEAADRLFGPYRPSGWPPSSGHRAYEPDRSVEERLPDDGWRHPETAPVALLASPVERGDLRNTPRGSAVRPAGLR